MKTRYSRSDTSRRIQWVLGDLGFDSVAARSAVSSLLRYPMEFVDVDADRLVTADRDFEHLCADEPFAYVDPVPENALAECENV